MIVQGTQRISYPSISEYPSLPPKPTALPHSIEAESMVKNYGMAVAGTVFGGLNLGGQVWMAFLVVNDITGSSQPQYGMDIPLLILCLWGLVNTIIAYMVMYSGSTFYSSVKWYCFTSAITILVIGVGLVIWCAIIIENNSGWAGLGYMLTAMVSVVDTILQVCTCLFPFFAFDIITTYYYPLSNI